jgi:hypothetical protein
MHTLGPRGAKYLDPLVRRVSVYRALLRIFAGTWMRQAVLVVLSACAMMGSPVGTNRLLGYVERSGAGETVRPWVWIALIGLAPLAQSALDQLYMYYNTRTAAQLEAIMTSAIARHALRIRVLNAAEEEERPAPLPVPSPPKSDTAQAPRAVDGQAPEAAAVHSRAESSMTATTLVASTNGAGRGQGKSQDGKKKQGEKTQDVVGRLNVLVTADLKNIGGGTDWIRGLFSAALQAVLGSWYV